jgi:hypothetical protein
MTTTQRVIRTPAGRYLIALLIVLVLAGAVDVVALVTASGVTEVAPDDFQTEFVDPIWWNVGWLLVVPVFIGARMFPKIALPLALCAGLPQFVVAYVVVQRYRDSGWSDGLEVLSYVQAAAMAVAFLAAALVGYLVAPSRNESFDHR